MQRDTYVDAGRIPIAAATAELITHLAVGDASVGSSSPDPAAVTLQSEIARVRYLQRLFVVADSAGPIIVGSQRYSESATPTRFIYYRFRFLGSEALGSWSELGLFGDGVTYLPAAATLADLAVAGDDHANGLVQLLGAWQPSSNGTVDIVVTTGGGPGVAKIDWSSGLGAIPPAQNVPVFWNTPIVIPGSGMSIVFLGGGDGLLTLSDSWRINGTVATARPEYAANGVYNVSTNPTGQVLAPGTLFRLTHNDPPDVKLNVTVDVQQIVEVIRHA